MRNPGWLLLILCGCATTNELRAGRDFSGAPFVVRQTPHGGGGRITGQICGNDINYEYEGQGGRLSLVGFLNGDVPSRLDVQSSQRGHHITGSLGTEAGLAAVDLHLAPERLSGRVGFRRFDLVQQGDQFSGPMRIAGTDDPSTATVTGVAAMWALPEATRAAVLANLLTCFVARVGVLGRSPLVVGFGGPPGAQPRDSSSVPRS